MTGGFLELLSPAHRELILRGSRRVHYRPGAVAYVPFRDDGTPQIAMVVQSGLVRLFAQSEDGRQASVAYFHPADLFTAHDILPPPSALLQALEESDVLMLDANNLFHLATHTPAIAEAGFRIAGRELSRLIRTITVRSLGSMTERLAYDLLERASESQLRGGHLVCEATHEQLADSIGSTREGVTRIVGELRKLGVLVGSPGRIRVLDPARLSLIVRGLAT